MYVTFTSIKKRLPGKDWKKGREEVLFILIIFVDYIYKWDHTFVGNFWWPTSAGVTHDTGPVLYDLTDMARVEIIPSRGSEESSGRKMSNLCTIT